MKPITSIQGQYEILKILQMALLRTVFQKRKQYFDPGFWSISLTRWELHRVTIEMKAHKQFYLWTFVGRDSHRLLFYYKSVFTILQLLGSGYHEIKVNELPDWEWAWSRGTKAATELTITETWRFFASVFFFVLFCFFAVVHPTCKHALRKESTSVLWTIWIFRWSAPKKCQHHLIFVITVEWISPVKHRVQKRWPK